MPTFVMMTKLSPEVLGDPRGRSALGKEWLAKVNQVCPEVKWISHYAILGPYDFMDIYEAPDVQTAHKVSYLSRSQGAVNAETWQAEPYDQYLKLIEETVS